MQNVFIMCVYAFHVVGCCQGDTFEDEEDARGLSSPRSPTPKWAKTTLYSTPLCFDNECAVGDMHFMVG